MVTPIQPVVNEHFALQYPSQGLLTVTEQFIPEWTVDSVDPLDARANGPPLRAIFREQFFTERVPYLDVDPGIRLHLEWGPLAAGPTRDTSTSRSRQAGQSMESMDDPLSVGVVTPHNAQRGALEAVLPDSVTANTVNKYQGGERDVIAVSATVSDPRFARQEERFILNPRRLLVAISRSKLLTVVVCSTALFEVAPQDSERLEDGPV
jgi:hypothetical protein